MKKTFALLAFILIFISACNLAGDITPPPALATQQAILPEPTLPPVASIPPDESAPLAMLVPPDEAPDLLNGEGVYTEKCAPCHGNTGRGDGSMSGNLEIAPTSLGSTEIGRNANPTEWYEIVSSGRMNRFMPPFSSLTDQERWNVVGYALRLSVPHDDLERGKVIYNELCASCHGEAGDTPQNDVRLADSASMAMRSLADTVSVISMGVETMPGFDEVIDFEDQWALSAYVRSLATGDEIPEVADIPEVEESLFGTINGTVIHGAVDETSLSDLEIVLLGFDGDQPVLTETTVTDSSGTFSFSNLEMVPGRIYGAFVENDGVRYYSTAVHFIEGESFLDLPIVVFDATTDNIDLTIERVHLVFDYSIEDLVDVSELWLVSNSGDQTIVGNDDMPIVEIPLPDGYGDLQLADPNSFGNLSYSDDRILFDEPVFPGETVEIVFSFTLPYDRSLKFEQSMTAPVGAIVALAPADTPEIRGTGVENTGTRDMGGTSLQTYSLEPPEAGESLTFDISGSHPISSTSLDTSNIVISLGILGLALVLVGLGWWYTSSRRELPEFEDSRTETPLRDKQTLLNAIAVLDDVFEAGEVSEKEYKKQRSELKDELSGLMSNEHD